MRKFATHLCVLAILLTMIVMSGCTDAKSTVDSPFKHTYTIGESLQTADSDFAADNDAVLIQLDEYHTLWICSDTLDYDYTMIGRFEAAEEEGDSFKGPWTLFTDAEQTEQYFLQLEDDGGVILSFSKNDNLQWKYRLHRIDLIDCNVMTSESLTTIYPEWMFPGTFSASLENLIYLSGANIPDKGTVQLTVHDESITALTVYEAYYTDGTVEYNEYTLENNFKLSVSTRYESGEQFAIYRISCGEVECWFYLKFD